MFHSMESALRWAFLVNSLEIIEGPSINKMCCKPDRTTTNELLIGMTREEIKQQATNIVQMVNDLEKVDPAYKEIITAEFGYQRDDSQMANLMIRVFGAMGTGVHKRRGVRDIVLNYLGVNVGMRQIRKNLSCNMNDVHKYRDVVFDAMETIRYRALSCLHDQFVDKGLIESVRKTACAR